MFYTRFRSLKITIIVRPDQGLEETYLPIYRLIRKFQGQWPAVGAVISLAGGLLSPIIATLLYLIVSFTRLNYGRAVLNKISVLLYVMTIPLLMLGAHFLDLLDKRNVDLRTGEGQLIEQKISNE